MKKILRLISVVLSITVVIASITGIGFLSVSAEDTADWDYYTVLNYNGANAPSINDTNIFGWGNTNQLPNREFTANYVPEGSKWTLKFTTPAAEVESNIKNIYFKNLSNSDYAVNSNGMRMWVANPSEDVVSINWNYISGGSNSTVGTGKAYYLQSQNNENVYKLTTRTATNDYYGAIEIPAGFIGWLYVPYNSGSVSSVKDPQQIRLYIVGNKTKDVSIYTSRIEYFSKTAVTLATTADFAFDTLLPDSADGDFSSKKVVAGSGTCIFALDETVFEGESGQSVKVKYSSGSTPTSATLVNFALVGFCTSLASDTTGDGISFWIKNDESVDVKLTVTVAGYNNINKNAPYYLKPDGSEAYTAYTVSSTKETARSAIVIPANFEGKVYLPYTTGGSKVKASGNLVLMGNLSAALPEITMNFDNFRPYNFEEIGSLTTTTFDNLTTLDTQMYNINGNATLSTEDTDGGRGKSVKATVSSANNIKHNFRQLAPSTDFATYVGREGYRFWISNPNNFAITAMPQFFTENARALVNQKYYLVYENGGATVNTFKALHPLAGEQAGYNELGCMIVPANFRGYVYIPVASIFHSGLDANAITVASGWQVSITLFQTEEDSFVYIDSYGMYTEQPEASKVMRSVPTIFSDGVLFQQKKSINVWGYNLKGTEVVAKLYKGDEMIEEVTTTSNSDNRFDISFAALNGSYDTYRIEISDSIGVFATINDILIGELWLSGGQSNMEFVIGNTNSYEEILSNINTEYLRFFLEPTRPYLDGTPQPLTPCYDIQDAYWEHGNTTTNALKNKMSAVAAVFAYNIQKELNVPVGVINTAVGGTRIHQWISRDAIESNEEMLELYKNNNLYFPITETKTKINYTWSVLYNAKIAPLSGLNIAGTIWYQGESNSNYFNRYAKELDLLKESWGEAFGFENDSMPFIYTQVAPDCYDNGENNWFQLGYLAEAMNDAFKMNQNNNTAMITLYDVSLAFGNEGEIHPNVKIPVGERFANSAMNLCYGGTKEASAPVFDSVEIKGDTVYVKFTHVGEGLECTGNSIHGFNIAGEDGVYVNAKAKIVDKDTVMVWNDNLKTPKNVTYAFANMNQASNLVNSEGIPAAPFRSDSVAHKDSMNTYMTIEEWMFADADAWESIDGKQSSFKPSWTVTDGAEYLYDTDVKTEGKASLKVTFTGVDSITASPVINTYDGKAFDIAKYKNIKLDIKANAGAAISLVVDGVDYGEAIALQNAEFNTVCFTLDTEIASKAKIGFKISGLTNDAFYIDNIAVGMTEKAAVFGDLNDDARIDSIDLIMLRKVLLGSECECNFHKKDANADNVVDIRDLVRLKKIIANTIK